MIVVQILFFLLLSPALSSLVMMDKDILYRIFEGWETALIFFSDIDNKECDHAHQILNSLPQLSLPLIVTETSRQDPNNLFNTLSTFLGLNTTVTPKIVMVKDVEKKYEYDQTLITVEKILSFITDSQAGKIKLHYKSQAVPESNDGVVKTAVGDTFQELVVNCPEEAIVMFFAPWCGVCHKLEPHFEAAASRLAHNPNIKFVRIDATENQIEGHPIPTYPTVKFWVKNKEAEPVVYNSTLQTADDLIQFLKQNTQYTWLPEQDFADDL